MEKPKPKPKDTPKPKKPVKKVKRKSSVLKQKQSQRQSVVVNVGDMAIKKKRKYTKRTPAPAPAPAQLVLGQQQQPLARVIYPTQDFSQPVLNSVARQLTNLKSKASHGTGNVMTAVPTNTPSGSDMEQEKIRAEVENLMGDMTDKVFLKSAGENITAKKKAKKMEAKMAEEERLARLDVGQPAKGGRRKKFEMTEAFQMAEEDRPRPKRREELVALYGELDEMPPSALRALEKKIFEANMLTKPRLDAINPLTGRADDVVSGGDALMPTTPATTAPASSVFGEEEQEPPIGSFI